MRDDGVTHRVGLMQAARTILDVRDVADTLFDHVEVRFQ